MLGRLKKENYSSNSTTITQLLIENRMKWHKEYNSFINEMCFRIKDCCEINLYVYICIRVYAQNFDVKD